MLPRAFVQGHGNVGQLVEVAGDDGHHYARVLRVKVGEPLVVAMENGPWYGEIVEVGNRDVRVKLVKAWRNAEATTQVTVVQSVAKGDKMDTIVQKCTEVGAYDFVIYESDRSVSRIGNKLDAKLARWQKMSREAAMQSQRDLIPQIHYAGNINQLFKLLETAGTTHFLILDEDETSMGLRAALRRLQTGEAPGKIAIFIGPEGGISDSERQALKARDNVTLVTMGPRILRTETAGVVALTMILSEYGDMGG